MPPQAHPSTTSAYPPRSDEGAASTPSHHMDARRRNSSAPADPDGSA
eukprot:CAMPEP_0113666678 /NCGR_PEP_ID=MMETSP0038_2-20120614/3011_1 /TAXON_ID=2898 /ORGANISM="Cryptomonas paramecium" /LENGTH=46 /DNA_ID=CAMNT_0000582203 /DNA_START=214 /DNA_END=351 /DNA_ORIENTATION=+ /assembly_acc=CAM_ASM_000170